MRRKRELLLPFVYLLLHLNIDAYGEEDFVLAPEQPYDRDFNFHNKTTFLIDHIKKLIHCIEPAPNSNLPTHKHLPQNESLFKSSESPSGKERFVFKYIGTREYNESCLGDSYKRDFIRRLYDAACMKYTEKVRFLEALSCNATQNLECRQVGVEPLRQFAEQATPVMRCMCPDYNKTQAYLADTTLGYFNASRKMCVLKVGKKCTIVPKILDKRQEWNDVDYVDEKSNNITGIDVVDLRPMAKTYPCVNNAFCYTNDSKGLTIDMWSQERCVCEAGYFSGADRECHPGRDSPSAKGVLLAVIMYSIGLLTFVALLLP